MQCVLSECNCPKCTKRRIDDLIKDGENRRNKEHEEMERAFNDAIKDWGNKYWPCGEPR